MYAKILRIKRLWTLILKDSWDIYSQRVLSFCGEKVMKCNFTLKVSLNHALIRDKYPLYKHS
jgi:hypothetical protein